MPKGFSEREKELIRAKLLQKGKEHFERYGLKKTNVEDLTKAAGISKGAFYTFYDSKEELFFEILEQFEADYRHVILQDIALTGPEPQERFKNVLHRSLTVWRSHPLFTHFSDAEREHLMRKLPLEKLQAHIANDDAFAAEFIGAWRREGIMIACAPELVSGLIRSLFFINLHEHDFGDGVFPEVIDVLMTLVARYLVSTDETAQSSPD